MLRSIAGAGSLVLAACSAVSPPPLIPMHAGTAPAAVDETTITVVVGIAGEVLGAFQHSGIRSLEFT